MEPSKRYCIALYFDVVCVQKFETAWNGIFILCVIIPKHYYKQKTAHTFLNQDYGQLDWFSFRALNYYRKGIGLATTSTIVRNRFLIYKMYKTPSIQHFQQVIHQQQLSQRIPKHVLYLQLKNKLIIFLGFVIQRTLFNFGNIIIDTLKNRLTQSCKLIRKIDRKSSKLTSTKWESKRFFVSFSCDL